MNAPFQPSTCEKPFALEVRALQHRLICHPPAPDTTLFYGSSSFRLWTHMANQFPNLKVLNHGFGGSTLADCLEHFETLVAPVPMARLVLYGGDNDLANGATPTSVLANLKRIGEALDASHPGLPLYVFTVKPSPCRAHLMKSILEFNAGVRKFATERAQTHLVDPFTLMLDAQHRPNHRFFTEDWLHLNESGYELWARLLKSAFLLSGAMSG